MKILVLSEFVRRFPWSAGLWAAHLGVALARRGHAVTAACDGVEDPTLFGRLPLLIRSPERGHRKLEPRSFQGWGNALVESGDFDCAISLTPLVPAHLWAPVSPTATSLVRTMLRVHSPIAAAMELAARPWLPLAIAAEASARSRWLEIGRRRRWSVGFLGTNSAPPSSVPLGYASRFERPEGPEREALRVQSRHALGIGPDRPVLLASAVHLQRGGLRPMLEGVVEARRGQPSLVVVIAGRRTHAIETEAQKAGCIDSVRIIGATSRMDALLAAADLAVSPWVGSGLSGGRFVADALRLGCPVLAHRGSPGAELVEPTHFGTPELGGIVARATAQAWAQAIGETLSRERLTGAERAARDAGAVVSMDAMAARVESILAAAQQG